MGSPVANIHFGGMLELSHVIRQTVGLNALYFAFCRHEMPAV